MNNLEISQSNQEEAAAWRALMRHKSWKKVTAVLKQKVAEADAVINQIGGDREIEYSKRDVAIIKKNSYLDLIELPEKMIEQLSGTGVEHIEELDPYEEGGNYEIEDF